MLERTLVNVDDLQEAPSNKPLGVWKISKSSHQIQLLAHFGQRASVAQWQCVRFVSERS
jgi:hypothetical protein